MNRLNANRGLGVGGGIVLGVVVGVLLTTFLKGWPAVLAGPENEAHLQFDRQAETFRNAAKKIAPAVVNIQTYTQVLVPEQGADLDWFGRFYRQRWKKGWERNGIGSGFVIDAEKGYILTNNHVIANGEGFVVSLKDQRDLKAQLVAADPLTDIAILQVDEPRGLQAAVPGDSNKVQVGDWVLAVGNPFGMLEQTVTAGIVSAKGRHGLGLSNYEDFLQTDAAINRGNSGGPLVNINGDVIGVNTAIYSKSGGYQGIGFAIPINQAWEVAKKLIKDRKVVRGWMGIKMRALTAQDLQELGLPKDVEGLFVDGVYREGPAHRAQIRPGDVVLTFNGQPVKDGKDISREVADMSPGEAVTLKLLRQGKSQEIKVRLDQQPANFGQE